MTCRTPVRSDPADDPRTAARPRRAGGLLVPALLLALLCSLVAACDREVEVPPPSASKDTSGDRADQSRKALGQLVEQLRSGARDDVEELATPEARQLLGWVHDNVAALRITDLKMRYIDEGAPIGEAQERELGEDAQDAWRGSVQLEYRYGGFDSAPAPCRNRDSGTPAPPSRARRPGRPPPGSAPAPHRAAPPRRRSAA